MSGFSSLDLAAFDAALARFAPPVVRWETPGDLARAIDVKTVQTEALSVIDEALVKVLNTPDGRLIVSLPPQEGKSQRVTKTGVLWALLQNPDLRVGIASYSQTLAEGFGREIRNWIANNNGDEGELDLGLRIAPDNGAAKRWQLNGHRGGVVCVGIGSGLTGRPLDLLVIDDPVADAAQADSEYYRNQAWDWWQSVGSTRLAPGAPVIVILTRWHEDDLAGRLLAADDGHLWTVVNIPALADHKPELGETDLLGRKPGEWLTSARGRTVEQWQAIQVRAGSRVFNSLYQGRPSPDTGNVWQRQWWQRFTEPMWANVNGVCRMECDEMLMSWDMTFKDTKGSDFVVGQVWARKGADVFLVDQVHRRMSFTQTIAAFERLVLKWPQATAKLVEDKANGSAVIDTLKSKIGGIVPITPKESKYSRANAVAPFIEAGNVHVWAGQWGDEFVDECASFPNGAHDDQVDGASQALYRMFIQGTGAGVVFLSAWKQQAADRAIEVPSIARNWREIANDLKARR
ncbi:phage terminase large subunit [Cryobacterium sp. GrIS_2_6]|uniref:phage terminase large subunit n=1 Tax=Cryobacterium sp. GrIS_2_6 TaxID=3162785 RepID=UPI002DF796A0|nr:putative phage terminase large subunit-like protein [Cryobacterium psychrotolerans]MEC5149236.1 putative phage terminase large subunit-like protein [Cryobacterium psychrotolerans]MEC5149314.1 putative phage terminase large subunit-like protein [Cryobacterium psychrotolerans]